MHGLTSVDLPAPSVTEDQADEFAARGSNRQVAPDRPPPTRPAACSTRQPSRIGWAPRRSAFASAAAEARAGATAGLEAQRRIGSLGASSSPGALLRARRVDRWSRGCCMTEDPDLDLSAAIWDRSVRLVGGGRLGAFADRLRHDGGVSSFSRAPARAARRCSPTHPPERRGTCALIVAM